MSVKRYLPAARYVAKTIPGLLANLGLNPFISRYVLTETEQGAAWLFIVLEVNAENEQGNYSDTAVLSELSTRLHGLPVVSSRSYGLRYAVLLSSLSLLNERN
jgi:hypothetical protein